MYMKEQEELALKAYERLGSVQNGFAALDIRSHRRYVVVKPAAGSTRLPP